MHPHLHLHPHTCTQTHAHTPTHINTSNSSCVPTLIVAPPASMCSRVMHPSGVTHERGVMPSCCCLAFPGPSHTIRGVGQTTSECRHILCTHTGVLCVGPRVRACAVYAMCVCVFVCGCVCVCLYLCMLSVLPCAALPCSIFLRRNVGQTEQKAGDTLLKRPGGYQPTCNWFPQGAGGA